MRDGVGMMQVFKIGDHFTILTLDSKSRADDIVFEKFAWLCILEEMKFMSIGCKKRVVSKSSVVNDLITGFYIL